MWSATGRVKAYWVSVSTFILTTPQEIASRISSSADPDPPWNTRSNGFSLPYFAPTASWISFSTLGRSVTCPGLYTPWTLPNVAARMYRPRSPRPMASAVASASAGVLYSFSLISPTMPSSSPPTTPISSSMMVWALTHSSSSSDAMDRFSASGTAEPSHMCEPNSGSSPRATRSWDSFTSGRMKPSSLFLGQWSVCSAICMEYFTATERAKCASAIEPVTMSLTPEPDRYSAPPVDTWMIPSLSASANPRSAALSVWLDVTLIDG